MNQRRGLQRMIGTLPTHVCAGDASQFVVHKREQLIRRATLSVLQLAQQLRYGVFRVVRHVGSRSRLIITCRAGCMVGTGRFELPTCRLGGDRSIHLSYVPTVPILPQRFKPLAPMSLRYCMPSKWISRTAA